MGRQRAEHKQINHEECKLCTKCHQWKDLKQFSKKQEMWDGLMSHCKECDVQCNRQWRIANPEKARRNRQVCGNRWHNTHKDDFHYKIVGSLRRRVRSVIHRQSKSLSTLQLLGTTLDGFILHLEQQFTDGMTWDNYGKWHIDHIKPCAKFDLTKPEEQQACFHYTNLQPLWAKDNIAKRDSYVL